MRQGQDRRSPASAAARALVTARDQAAAIEADLAGLGRSRFVQRRRARELERDLREIRAVEARCLAALGAREPTPR